MFQLLEYYGRWGQFKSTLNRLPSWGRFLVELAGLPGIVLALLSLLALVVSILALFLFTVPVYRLVAWMSGVRRNPQVDTVAYARSAEVDGEESASEVVIEPATVVENPSPQGERPSRRQIEVRIVE